MRVALVLPKYGVPIDDPCAFPLGFMYVSSWLKRQGHKVAVFNKNLYEYGWLEGSLKKFDEVYFTGGLDFLEENAHYARYCKVSVLGGAVATHCPELARGKFTRVHQGEIEDCAIDDIPWPDYEAFGIDEYHRRHKDRYMGVLTSRGCPHRCSFCASTCRYRLRNLTKVQEEILHYQNRYGITRIVLNDNTLNPTKKRFLAVCEMLRPLGLQWSAAVRADNFDEEMVENAVASGAEYFVVGVESFDQRRLDKMKKGLTVEALRRTLDLFHQYGVAYHGNILLGFDGDTVEDVVTEVCQIPKKYTVFPVLLQPFAGVKAVPSIDGPEREQINALFTQYAQDGGLSVYPLV